MRDIRNDLRERLEALRTERDELQAQLTAKLKEIDNYEKNISALLALEERRGDGNGMKKTTGPFKKAEMRSDFEGAILRLLSDRIIWEHATIRETLEEDGWRAKRGSLGRVLQGILLGLLSRKLVEQPEPRKWLITDLGVLSANSQTKTGAKSPGSHGLSNQV